MRPYTVGMRKSEPPRYRQLADRLRASITNGEYQPGDPLPTEMRLCSEHGVSRHTAREALRILADDGLIERRQGAGSIVADVPAPAFAQPTGDFESILQYARNARFSPDASGEADDEQLAAEGLSGRYRWYRGLRQIGAQPPIALSTIYVALEFAPDEQTIAALDESVSEWIERTSDVWIDEVEQRMDAVALASQESHLLGVEPGRAALRTTRRYRDAAGRVVLLSNSLHPAGRFAYTMRMTRKR